ncbi:hypothetical protein FF1_028998 [Malus domestica]
MLNHNRLPQDINTFTDMMDIYFGKNVYDIKSMIRVSREIYGGLERVANKLGVDRVAGKSHQAAYDSLLTWQTFRKLTDVYHRSMLGEDGCSLDLRDLDWSQRVLYGLEVEAH